MSRTDLVMPSGKQATWEAIRRWVLDRDERTCQMCFSPADEVDHIWPRRLGGNDSSGNLQALCGPCNRAKGDRVDMRMATGDQLLAASEALGKKIERLVEELYSVASTAFDLDQLQYDDTWTPLLDSVICGLALQGARIKAVQSVARRAKNALAEERSPVELEPGGAA